MRGAWCLAVLLVGCAGSAPLSVGTQLPPDWDAGMALHPYHMYGDHGGGRGAALHPTEPLARPALCVAYRDNFSQAEDACEVRDPRYGWEEHAAWIVRATWAGCPGRDMWGCPDNKYPAPYEQRVVAFDGAGRPVAWWDGTPAEDTQFVTE